MCDKCVELDGKITHYLGIASTRTTDEAKFREINVLIARAPRRRYFTRRKKSKAASVGGLFIRGPNAVRHPPGERDGTAGRQLVGGNHADKLTKKYIAEG
jgi:hypothetical protein